MLKAIICGATAVGKSAFALNLARRNEFTIISADSRQMYADLHIGVNSPSPEEQVLIPHYLVSCLPITQTFSPREFALTTEKILNENPQTNFIVVGGSGLYLKEWLYPAMQTRGETPLAIKAEVEERVAQKGLAILHAEMLQLDPLAAAKVHPHDGFRIRKLWENFLITGQSYTAFASQKHIANEYASVPLLWIDEERDALYNRIDQRTKQMLKTGWLDEIQQLLKQNLDWESPGLQAIGYKELADTVTGKLPLEKAVHLIQQQTRKYAKKQITFFKNQFPTAKRILSSNIPQEQKYLEANGLIF